jgi:hypothetical protein
LNDDTNGYDELTPQLAPRSQTTYDVRKDAEEAVRRYQAEKAVGRTTPMFGAEVALRLDINESNQSVSYTLQTEAVLGRTDPKEDAPPEIDLTRYGAYQMGLSRRHAMLRLREGRLEIIDLESRNGTFVNGLRLNSHQPMALAHTDELRLGRMVLTLYIETEAID